MASPEQGGQPGPEAQAFTAPVAQAEQAGTYDHLFDPNFDASKLTIEGAARPAEAVLPAPAEAGDAQAMTAAVEAAAVRPTGELTPAEIAKIEAHRGQSLTAEEIKHMGSARSAGKLLSVI